MESYWHDWRVAVRMMRNKPAFSLAVAGMLALGVAGNAAIFSIFNGLFLRPLPFPEPARLVDLDETAPKWNLARGSINNPNYDAWQKGNSTFDGTAFFSAGGANLSTEDGGAHRVKTASVTKDRFRCGLRSRHPDKVDVHANQPGQSVQRAPLPGRSDRFVRALVSPVSALLRARR